MVWVVADQLTCIAYTIQLTYTMQRMSHRTPVLANAQSFICILQHNEHNSKPNMQHYKTPYSQLEWPKPS